ncbi:hypothetical protein SteCoe_31682 [Stentor coeruleus]|uniref:Uncharacterized protein n=1 Tax=Stentor coeruleus TaxID=5963 RepID=A0A1R2B0Q7_9CILI|nr:hypothetical protein SteCoe_31682 [Stentor coeruleus]
MYNPSIAVYRRLLKALRIKFIGDRKTYVQFKNAFKIDILKFKDEQDPIKISKVIFDLDVTREWLLTEVMRADLQDDGKYKMKFNKELLQSIKIKPVKHPEYFEFDISKEFILK